MKRTGRRKKRDARWRRRRACTFRELIGRPSRRPIPRGVRPIDARNAPTLRRRYGQNGLLCDYKVSHVNGGEDPADGDRAEPQD